MSVAERLAEGAALAETGSAVDGVAVEDPAEAKPAGEDDGPEVDPAEDAAGFGWVATLDFLSAAAVWDADAESG